MRQISFHLLAILATILLVGGCMSTAQIPTSTVQGKRQVEKAVEQIEAIYVVPVNYEDIRYVHPSELRTDDKGRLTTKFESVSFPSDDTCVQALPKELRQSKAKNALSAMVENYNSGRGAEMFRVVTVNGILNVVGIRSTSVTGQIEPVQLLLDTPISVAGEDRTAQQLVKEIARQVTAATGRVIFDGTLPNPLFGEHHTNIAANNEPARAVLQRLFDEIPVGYASKPDKAGGTYSIRSALSWQITCNRISDPECWINAHVVAPAGRGAVGLEGQPPKSIRDEP